MTAYHMSEYEQDDFFYQLGVSETEKAHQYCNENTEKLIYAINKKTSRQRAIRNLWRKIDSYGENIGNNAND